MTKKNKLILLIISSFFSLPSFAQSNEQGYYDFNSQKMVSKEEYERKQDRLASCSDEASRRVEASIADGTIPLTSDASNNADWQRAFHSEYVKQCLDRK